LIRKEMPPSECYASPVSEPAAAGVSYEDYLALEQKSGEKHEYVDGLVRAMAGGTIEHGRLASRFAHLLGAALAGQPCEAFSSDTKIRIDASNRTTYADLSVVCGRLERSAQDAEAIANPVAIVEVLSDSTEAYDRGEKFRHYRRLASLREYVLVSQHEALVEVWRRDGERWTVLEHGPGGVVRLEACGADVAVDALYARALAS
jgi:Uma2 family endonuclease